MKGGNLCSFARLILVGVGLLAFSAGMPGFVMGEEGVVESRGLPGAPSQQGQAPTFPQKFDVQGPETHPFGFAVTQPGPITVDVQGQGAPILVILQSLGGQPITQQGTGMLHIPYTVTPQDVQRSIFWQVQIRLAQPMPPQMGGRASGTVNVQYPPPDLAAVKRASEAQSHIPSKEDIAQAQAQADAQITQTIAARKAQFAQDQERRAQADRARIQPMLDRMGGSLQVRPRGIEGSNPEEVQPAQAAEEVASRGGLLPPRDFSKVVPFSSGPPHITSLSETSGGPIKAIVITGTNFSTTAGQVYFTAPPDKALLATVTNWTDTGIGVVLPNVTGVMPYQAKIYVQRGQDLSNQVPFDFVPRQELRTIRNMTDDKRHSGPTVVTMNIDGPHTQMMHIRIPVFPFSEFVGEKGNDEFFLRTQLKNGWVIQGTKLVDSKFNVTASVASLGTYQWLGAAYIQDQGSGPNPYINVRWWVNPFTPFTSYSFLVDIVGPEGVPDGIVMP